MAFDRDKLIAELERPTEEGFRPVPYDDKTGRAIATGDTLQGKLTTGIGWNLQGLPLTRPQARVICGWKVDDIGAALEGQPWFDNLDEVRARAVANAAYQMGVHGLLQFGDMITALKARAWDAAADAALDSQWARETPNRAKRIAAMIRTGQDQP